MPDSKKCLGNFWTDDSALLPVLPVIKSWLNDCDIPYFNDWPKNSGVFNPKENVWNPICNLHGMDMSSLPKILSESKQVWEGIDSSILHTLALSVPRRLKYIKREDNHMIYKLRWGTNTSFSILLLEQEFMMRDLAFYVIFMHAYLWCLPDMTIVSRCNTHWNKSRCLTIVGYPRLNLLLCAFWLN